jgi:hypothetical protein
MIETKQRTENVAALIRRAFNIPPLDKPPIPCPPDTLCAIQGTPITEGYPVLSHVRPTTGEYLDMFRGGVDGWLSEDAAIVFDRFSARAGYPGSMLIRNGVRVDVQSWIDALQNLTDGDEVVIIVATDPKKRVWPRARVGIVGPSTPILLFAGNQLRVINCSIDALIESATYVEELISLGASKRAIATSLVASPWKATLQTRIYHERQIRPHRDRPEWPVALTIARKRDT